MIESVAGRRVADRREGPESPDRARVRLASTADGGAGDARSAAERRAARRVQLLKFAWYCSVDATGADAVEGLARSCDVSATGAALVAARSLAVGTRLFLEVVSGELSFSALGVVVWTAPADLGQVRVGVHFQVVPPNDRVCLTRYCAHEQP